MTIWRKIYLNHVGGKVVRNLHKVQQLEKKIEEVKENIVSMPAKEVKKEEPNIAKENIENAVEEETKNDAASKSTDEESNATSKSSDEESNAAEKKYDYIPCSDEYSNCNETTQIEKFFDFINNFSFDKISDVNPKIKDNDIYGYAYNSNYTAGIYIKSDGTIDSAWIIPKNMKACKKIYNKHNISKISICNTGKILVDNLKKRTKEVFTIKLN